MVRNEVVGFNFQNRNKVLLHNFAPSYLERCDNLADDNTAVQIGN